jgi:hypothetical protein
LVYSTAIASSWDEIPTGLLDGLVCAYVAQATYDAFEEAEGDDDVNPDFELVSGNEAEDIYRKFIINGYRAASKVTSEDASDDRVYESCDWYESIVDNWPDQLLAEIAYAKGRRAAREAIAMSEYYKAHKSEFETEKTA